MSVASSNGAITSNGAHPVTADHQKVANDAISLGNKKVVAERTIFYCCNFDLCFSEWVNIAENLATFKENLINELGKLKQNNKS